MKKNPFEDRLNAFVALATRKRLDAVLVSGEANLRSLTGVVCDNATLLIRPFARKSAALKFYTDFRYVPMVHRVAPWLKVGDIRRVAFDAKRIGCEFAALSHARFEQLRTAHKSARFVDVSDDLLDLRAVKTADEIARLRAAEALDCAIWKEASAAFRPGMTEREMARQIQHLMIEKGEGEAFETIVCIGRNAAECHHVPDDTVWNGREPVLVDMGVKLGGYCSDLTRNLVPKRPAPLYRKVYALVEQANRAAIAAAKPGMTCGELDAVARRIIAAGGFGKCFGHALGHGVGIEIHESPVARKGGKTVLKPGMLVTIEPGIYLEDNLGVRIEDLILITETGCERLSSD